MPMPGSSLAGSSGCAPGGTMHMSGCGAGACLPLAATPEDDAAASRTTKPSAGDVLHGAQYISGRRSAEEVTVQRRQKSRRSEPTAQRDGAGPIQVVAQAFVRAAERELVPRNRRVVELRRLEALVVDAERAADRRRGVDDDDRRAAGVRVDVDQAVEPDVEPALLARFADRGRRSAARRDRRSRPGNTHLP